MDAAALNAEIWNVGVKMLTETGGKEREVRSLLGDLAKKHGRPQLAAAIRETRASEPVDPRGYLIKVLRDRSSRAAVGKSVLVDETPATCTECKDTKKIFVQREGSTFDWDLVPKECPKCS